MATVTVNLDTKLDCDVCTPDVLMKIHNPFLLLINSGVVDPALLRFIFLGQILSYTMLQSGLHQYELEYDEAILLDPLSLLTEEDIRQVCCSNCLVEYINELNLP
jgi:hypothetical protein